MTDNTTITDPVSMAFALAAGGGETFWWESQLFTIKCSDGGLGLVDCTLEAGSEPPMHIHTRETEFIYVLDGELTVVRRRRDADGWARRLCVPAPERSAHLRG